MFTTYLAFVSIALSAPSMAKPVVGNPAGIISPVKALRAEKDDPQLTTDYGKVFYSKVDSSGSVVWVVSDLFKGSLNLTCRLDGVDSVFLFDLDHAESYVTGSDTEKGSAVAWLGNAIGKKARMGSQVGSTEVGVDVWIGCPSKK